MSIAPRGPCILCEPIVEQLEAELYDMKQTALNLAADSEVVITALRERVMDLEASATREAWRNKSPVDLVLHCPACQRQHLDIGEFATRIHRKHLCENTPDGPGTGCGHLWMPFEYATRGVLEVLKPEDS